MPRYYFVKINISFLVFLPIFFSVGNVQLFIFQLEKKRVSILFQVSLILRSSFFELLAFLFVFSGSIFPNVHIAV